MGKPTGLPSMRDVFSDDTVSSVITDRNEVDSVTRFRRGGERESQGLPRTQRHVLRCRSPYRTCRLIYQYAWIDAEGSLSLSFSRSLSMRLPNTHTRSMRYIPSDRVVCFPPSSYCHNYFPPVLTERRTLTHKRIQ